MASVPGHDPASSLEKAALPFRLGSTSYVFPGDLVHNATHLAGWAQDIELVLFDLPGGASNMPDAATVAQLAALGQANGLSYTVHLPLDLRSSRGKTHPSLQAAGHVIGLTAPLKPYAYVFHLDGAGVEHPGWTDQAIDAIDVLLGMVPAPEHLALENLESYDPEHLLPVFDALPIRRTLDIGHLWLTDRDPLPVMAAWLPHTAVVHLHGLTERDHQSLAAMDPAQLDPVTARLLGWDGVLTLEVFEEDFFSSRAALLASVERVRAAGGGAPHAA